MMNKPNHLKEQQPITEPASIEVSSQQSLIQALWSRKISDNHDIQAATHAWMTDSFPLENGEFMNRQVFMEYVREYSAKAVQLLPVNGIIKQKILQEIGIQPYDAEKINAIYKIGRQRISENNRRNPNVYGECQPRYKNGKFSFIIAMENHAPKKVFLHFLYHEIDHMVGYLGYWLAMKEMGYNEDQVMEEGLMNEVRSMKTEFFARVNTANEAMLGAESRDFVFKVGTGQTSSKQDIYSQSKNYATKYIGARNRLYNLLLKKYGSATGAKSKYAAIQEPWYTQFANLCTSFAKYLLFIDSLEWFKDFIDRMSDIISSSHSIEQAINRLSGETGEIKLKGKDLNLVKKLWDQHRNILLSCQ